ncbi:Serine/threonine-protein phosphatase PP1 [Dirofilaria immitis]
MVLSGCFIVLIFSIAILPIVRSSKQCGNEYIPLVCSKNAMCIAMRSMNFRCDMKGWCKQHCPGLLLNRKWCLLSNLTHDIKCCLHNRCNWEQMPIFVITKRKFKFLPGMKTLAHLLTPFVLFIFTIYPIASTFIHKWMVTAYREIEYNPKFDTALPQKEGIIFQHLAPKSGEPLDGCLNIEEFAEVMKALAEYKGNKEEKIVATPVESITYVSYEVHESLGFDYAVIVRTEPTKFESLLIRMIEQGPGFFDIEGSELYELLSDLSEILRIENSLLEITADVVVIGELRGGIIDEECAESIETLAFLAAYKLTTPHHIYMLRGATEFFPFQIRNRFPVRLNKVLSAFITRICSEMPIAAVIGNKIFAVHSGISSRLKNLNAIKKIERPLLKWDCQIPYDLILGMPSTDVETFQKIKGGRGHLFGLKAIEEFIKQLQIKLIIRTRTPHEKGHFMFASNQILTIWSSNCHNVKSATSLYIDPQLHVSIHCMTPVIVKTIAADQLPETVPEEEIVKVEERGKPDEVQNIQSRK